MAAKDNKKSTTKTKANKKKTVAKKNAPKKTEAKKAAVKKPAAKKPTTKKPVAKKAATKKTTVKKAATKKPAAKKAATKKTATKKPAAKKTATKKTVVKKTATKKPAAKKVAPKKTTPKKKESTKKTAVKKVEKTKAAVKKDEPKKTKPKDIKITATVENEQKTDITKSKVETKTKNPDVVSDTKITTAVSSKDFAVNDFVIYPSHGIGKIIEIQSLKIMNKDFSCYLIYFEKERLTIKVPINSSKEINLRHIVDKKTIEEVFAILRSGVKKMKGMWSRRAQEYEAKINSGDIFALAEVLRDLARDIEDSERSYSERIIYETAINRLASEYAAIYGTDLEEAKEIVINTAKDKVGEGFKDEEGYKEYKDDDFDDDDEFDDDEDDEDDDDDDFDDDFDD